MKWLVLIFGPSHQAKDIKSLLFTEYKNLNIIIVFIQNKKKTNKEDLFK